MKGKVCENLHLSHKYRKFLLEHDTINGLSDNEQPIYCIVLSFVLHNRIKCKINYKILYAVKSIKKEICNFLRFPFLMDLAGVEPASKSLSHVLLLS